MYRETLKKVISELESKGDVESMELAEKLNEVKMCLRSPSFKVTKGLVDYFSSHLKVQKPAKKRK